MEFDNAIHIVKNALALTGTVINETKYDGLIVKKLKASNTLGSEDVSHQTHIAITGSQMDIFPYVKSDGYFREDNSDDDLKKYFITQIPVCLYKTNLEYLGWEDFISNDYIECKTSVVRSKRKKQADQLQISLLNFDTESFVAFRRLLRPDSILIVLKRENQLKYDVFGIIPNNKINGEAGLDQLNNRFFKLPTQTVVEVANVVEDNGYIDEGNEELFTPGWFRRKAEEFPNLDEEARALISRFRSKYSVERLESLKGQEILTEIFLNKENTDNLCYALEFDVRMREVFGSIKGGSAFKYGLFYSSENVWKTGTAQNPIKLSLEEALKVGTELRNNLVAGAKVIAEFGEINSIKDYNKLNDRLVEATCGDINKLWFLKYYQMIFPNLFGTSYSYYAQDTVLKTIGIMPEKDAVSRLGQMCLFADSCGISNVMFNKVFWEYYSEEVGEKKMEKGDTICYKTDITSDFPHNRIVFGAPGTGKSFKLNKDKESLLNGRGRYERVTFHPDYSYANFVGTYKPVPKKNEQNKEVITYKYVPGPFMRVLVEALKSCINGDKTPYLLIIEEINRSNVAAVFGDVFQLLDRDNDGVSQYPIQLSEDARKYLADELGINPEACEEIRIPDNMFIWATMNSADQGVYPMDTAFKRRWDFTYIGIDEEEKDMPNLEVVLGHESERRKVEWNSLRKAINSALSSYGINEDKLIGPYFITRKELGLDASSDVKLYMEDSEIRSRFVKVFKNKVLMYLFEDAARQKRKTLFGSCDEEDRNQYSRICKVFDERGVFIFDGKIASLFSENVLEDD